jgi:hypothetical protein
MQRYASWHQRCAHHFEGDPVCDQLFWTHVPGLGFGTACLRRLATLTVLPSAEAYL